MGKASNTSPQWHCQACGLSTQAMVSTEVTGSPRMQNTAQKPISHNPVMVKEDKASIMLHKANELKRKHKRKRVSYTGKKGQLITE